MLLQCHRLVCLLLFLICSSVALAQGPSIDPPRIGRPADFSNLVGQYEINAAASPTTVQVEQAITLRIFITGEGPAKYEPKRQYLRIIPESWDKDFYLADLHDEDQVDRARKTWTFVYRLKPKHTRIDSISGIKLVYYDPKSLGKVKFSTRFVDSIPLDVKPLPEGPGPALEVLAAPETFYQTIALDGTRNAREVPYAFSLLQVAVFLIAVPLICLLGAYFWRRYYPDDWERRRRQRHRAAEQAVAHLRRAAAPVWQVLSQYLRERHDFILEEPTPAEVARLLLRRGFARDLCVRCKELLQTCDALRYGQGPLADQKELAEEAIQLLTALEADPCAR